MVFYEHVALTERRAGSRRWNFATWACHFAALSTYPFPAVNNSSCPSFV